MVYFQNALGALIFLPLLILELPGTPVSESMLGVIYGFSAGIVGFGLFFYALKRLPIFQYGALTYIEVFWGVLYGVFFIGEVLTPNIIAGVLLILISSVLSRFTSQ